jgi:alpha-beta hydrolase superfamily lysophospholipase
MSESIQGVGDHRLFYHQSVPASPVAWVLIIHGWGEHSGRYAYVAEKLLASGFAMAMYDQRGHGKSEGLRTYVNSFSDYVDDLSIVYAKISQLANQKPVFVLAHSMGGLVACQFCIQHQPPIQGIVLSAASLKVNSDFSPFLQRISGIASALFPKLATVKLDNALLSRDPEILAIAEKDALHYKGGIRARTGAEILKATKWVEAHAHEFTMSVLVLHGAADKIADPQGSISFYEHCGSTDKQYKIYPGAYHEILNEINRDEVISDILKWLLGHVQYIERSFP